MTTNLKPFDIELAKAGHPVCLEDGTKVRVICTDVERYRPVAATHVVMGESVVLLYLSDGTRFTADRRGSLFMAPRKVTMYLLTWSCTSGSVEHRLTRDKITADNMLSAYAPSGAELHPIEVTMP